MHTVSILRLDLYSAWLYRVSTEALSATTNKLGIRGSHFAHATNYLWQASCHYQLPFCDCRVAELYLMETREELVVIVVRRQ